MDSIKQTKEWLEKIVIGLPLCPFASKVYIENQILFLPVDFSTIQSLIKVFEDSINTILDVHSHDTTALIIINSGLDNFEDYLDVFYTLEEKLIEEKKDKNIQLASFHPGYQFDGTKISDVSNYTNRSPYPIIHLLRTDLVKEAIVMHPDIESVPAQNIFKMEELGVEGIKRLFTS